MIRMADLKFGVMLPVMIPLGPRPLPLYHALQYGYRKLDLDLVKEAALEAERLGYHSVWVSDHFSRAACRERPECWTTMTWLAALTSRIRIGSMVLCNLYRHPSLLAKMASTLDVLSGGRLEFGIGACWSEDECADRGMGWPSNPVRLRMMREAVEICKGLWTQETTTYNGKCYQLENVYSEPKPLQKPHPPIMIGGGGEQFTLKIVARHADKSNFGGGLGNLKRRINVLRRYCELIGRDFDSIEKTSNIAVVVHESEEKHVEDMRRRWEAGGSPGSFEGWLEKAEAFYIAGTPEDCVEQLRPYVELGVSMFVIRFGDIPSLDGMKLFVEEVAPNLR
jgi:F420-dependent oxidoreductase-like protein